MQSKTQASWSKALFQILAIILIMWNKKATVVNILKKMWRFFNWSNHPLRLVVIFLITFGWLEAQRL